MGLSSRLEGKWRDLMGFGSLDGVVVEKILRGLCVGSEK